ncbi:unnamed protein product [Linum trigynum]|uniref:Uncharacterized protein n=1 Tax=Linum trigynum TaxID=586398 RepID=A0AAV2E115_9ROSI
MSGGVETSSMTVTNATKGSSDGKRGTTATGPAWGNLAIDGASSSRQDHTYLGQRYEATIFDMKRAWGGLELRIKTRELQATQMGVLRRRHSLEDSLAFRKCLRTG